MLDIVGIKASFVLTHLDDTIYFSARSIDEINVQIMMEKMEAAATGRLPGAQLKGATIEEAKVKLKEIITDMLEKGNI